MSLYHSLYGKPDEGIFGSGLFSRHGTMSPVKSTDVRLGQADLDDEEDDEPEAPAAAPSAPVSIPAGPKKKRLFERDFAGLPYWLVGIGLLGFAWAYKKRLKKV